MRDGIEVTMLKGINLLDDASQISDDELAYAKNIYPIKRGLLETRNAMMFSSLVGTTGSGTMATAETMRFIDFIFDDTPGAGSEIAVALAHMVDGTDAILTYGGKLGPLAYFAPAVTNIGGSKTQPWMMRYRDKVYVFNGTSNGWVVDLLIRDSNGAAVVSPFRFTFSQTGVYPSFMTVIRDRAVYAIGDQLLFSDAYTPDVVGGGIDFALARLFRVGNDGSEGPITGVFEATVTSAGTAETSVILVFKKRAMYIVQGEPGLTTDVSLRGTYTLSKVNTQAGLAAPNTFIRTKHGMFWAGEDDVWFMPFNSQPIRVGTKIQPALLASPVQFQHRWHAAFYDNCYRLAVFSDGQGPDDMSPCGDQYWLDCRPGSGPPTDPVSAQWWGPQQYRPWGNLYALQGTFNLKVDPRVNNTATLYSLLEQFWTTDQPATQGTSKGLNYHVLVSFDGDNEVDNALPDSLLTVWQPLTAYSLNDMVLIPDRSATGPEAQGRSDFSAGILQNNLAGTSAAAFPGIDYLSTIVDGTAHWNFFPHDQAGQHLGLLIPRSRQRGFVTTDIVTKEYDGGSGILDTLMESVELAFWASTRCNMNYAFIVGGVSNSQQVVINPGLELGPGQFGGSIERIFAAKILPPAAGVRAVGKTMQFRFWTDSLFVVDSTNDSFTIVHNIFGIFRCPLPHGLYDFLDPTDGLLGTIVNSSLNGLAIPHSDENWSGQNITLPAFLSETTYGDSWIVPTAWAASGPVGNFTALTRTIPAADLASNARLLDAIGYNPDTAIDPLITTDVSLRGMSVVAGSALWSPQFPGQSVALSFKDLMIRYKNFKRRSGPT